MSKIKLTGDSSGYVEISAGNVAGNNTLEAPTSGTRLVAHEGSQDVTLNGNLTVNGVVSYEDVTNIDSVGIITAQSGLHVTGGSVGIGTDNPSVYFSDANDVVLLKTDDCGITIASGASQKGTIAFADGTTGDQAYRGYIQYNHSTDSLQVATTGTERLRVTSTGNIGIGTDTPIGNLHLNYNGNNGTSFRMENFEGYSTFHNDGGAFYIDSGQHIFRSENGSSERFRIDSNGSALLTTTGQNTQYSYAMKLGQGTHNPNDATGPHYGLWVRQLGPRYELNYGVYSEVEDDHGFYGGETLDGLTSVRGVGVYGTSTTSSQARQKGIGVYGKATNGSYNYNTAIGVRGRVETGTTTFTNNDVERSFGGHFVATGKSNVVGVYADAYLDGSPGANQVAIPLLVSSNGSERLRVDSSARVIIDGSASGNNKLQINGTGDDTAFVRLKRTNGAGDDTAYGGINVVDNNNLTIGTAEFKNQDSTTRSQFVLSTYDNGSLNEVIRVKGSGAIGIGTDSPQQSSIPSIHLHTNTSDDARIAITTPTKPNSRIGYFGLSDKFGMDVHNGFEIRDASASYATRFTIDSAGNVGINRSSPNSKLHIMGGNLQVGDFSTDTYETKLSNNILSFKRNGDSYIDQLGNGIIHFRLGSSQSSVLRLQDAAEAVKVIGETALTGTTGGAKGLTLQTAGGTSCPLYFGSETNSAQKSMYLNGYWIYLRGHQNEGIRFIFSQAGGNAPRSDQYQFKYNQATRPTGNTTWDGFSDRRAKENIQDVTSALDTIGRLRPVTFDWTNDYADRMNMFNLDKTDPRSYMWTSVKENGYDETRKNNNVGFIAQEFEEVFPKDITETEMQLGDETITDFKTVNFDSLVPMLTKAVQELKAENDSLRARLDAAGL